MADLYFDRFAESKAAAVHHIKTVAIQRMLDSIDDTHAIGMTEHLWQPLLA